MAQISQFIEAPFQGVSQAPAQVRLETQAEEIVDCSITYPTGASKRPPTRWLAQLKGMATATGLQTIIDREEGRFLFALETNGVSVLPRLYPLDGLPTADPELESIDVPVSEAAQYYLNHGFPRPDQDMRLLTVEDYTFILNRKRPVENSGSVAPTRPYEALLWVREAAYARKYSVTVRWSEDGGATTETRTFTLTTPNGKDATDGDDVDTEAIAIGLLQGSGSYPTSTTGAANGGAVTGAMNTLGSADGFTIFLRSSIFYISHATYDFTMEVWDGQGGDALVAVKDSVQSVSSLPQKAPLDGFKVKVAQTTGTDADDFWMEWQDTSGPGTGIWAECLAPGAELGIYTGSLPVALLYYPDTATWEIDVVDWEQRTVGNEGLLPDPGFVGEVLWDIAYWRGRIALLYEDGCLLTSTTNNLRIYPSTLTTTLPDDPFEVVTPLTRDRSAGAKFRHAVPFKQSLILWGEVAQARVISRDVILTAETAVIEPYSVYDVSPLARPQVANDRVYFAAPRGSAATAIFEMELTGGSDGEAEGDDMSVSVPRYIPPGVNRAATCAVNYLSVYGRSGDDYVVPHSYRYSERSRVQNAWSKWQLPEGCTVAGYLFDNTVLYLLVLRDEAVYLLTVDTADGILDEGSTILTYLNFKVSSALFESSTYNAELDETTIILPYPPAVTPVAIVAAPGGAGGTLEEGGPDDRPEGTLPVVTNCTDRILKLSGDWTAAPLIVGEPYNGEITLSPFFYRDADGAPNRAGRMMIRKLIFEVDRAVSFQVEVQVGGRTPVVHTFESTLADKYALEFDQLNLYRGSWSVPIMGASDDVTIKIRFNSWAPASVLGYTMIAEVNPRSYSNGGLRLPRGRKGQ